jgi:hypothetical protein
MFKYKKELKKTSTWTLDFKWTQEALLEIGKNSEFVSIDLRRLKLLESSGDSKTIYLMDNIFFSRTIWDTYKEDASKALIFFLSKICQISISLVRASDKLVLESEKHLEYLMYIYTYALRVMELDEFSTALGEELTKDCKEILKSNQVINWKIETLVHADLHPGNILVRTWNKRQTKVIDWENITVGNVFFDLLSCNNYFCEQPNFFDDCLIHLEREFSRTLNLEDFAQPLSFSVIRLYENADGDLSEKLILGIKLLVEKYRNIQTLQKVVIT